MSAIDDRPAPKNSFNIRLGARLRQIRIFKKCSQAEAGKIINVTFQQWQKYETGANRISVESLHTICKAWDIEISIFVPDLGENGSYKELAEGYFRIINCIQKIEQSPEQFHLFAELIRCIETKICKLAYRVVDT